jgi:DNA-binding XRE family transcriptional regulator
MSTAQYSFMQKELYAVEKKIVQQLRDERLRQKLSYETLAEASGIHRTSISLIERGKSHPTLIMCLRLCSALGMRLGDIINHVDR